MVRLLRVEECHVLIARIVGALVERRLADLVECLAQRLFVGRGVCVGCALAAADGLALRYGVMLTIRGIFLVAGARFRAASIENARKISEVGG